jgi:hypothetical protein
MKVGPAHLPGRAKTSLVRPCRSTVAKVVGLPGFMFRRPKCTCAISQSGSKRFTTQDDQQVSGNS